MMTETPSPPTGLPVLSLAGAWKAFGHVVALRDASLDVCAGEIVAIVGDNGAGKSTLIKCLSGVHPLDAGFVRLKGQTVHSIRTIQKSLGVVYQDLALVDSLDVVTNLYLDQPIRFGRFFINKRAMKIQAAQAFEELRVTMPSMRSPVGDLSRGQRQAVAIARAVIGNYPIILFDEPTASLGIRETKAIAALLHRLRERGQAIVLVSHDRDLVAKCSDRVQVMRRGRIRELTLSDKARR
jgi:ABC-type sugar transport system ATPase subunit